MKKFKALILVLCMGMLALTFPGCENKTDLDSNGVPGKLLVAAYTSELPGQTKARYELFRAYLEKKLGVEVQFIYATDYTAVIEAIRSKKVHVAYLSPFSYILASQRHNITPLVTIGENGIPHMYHSIIITNNKTGLNNMDDVKKRAKTLTFCFSDPASTSGHLIPDAYLKTIGLDPDHAFKETMFAGSHPAAILSVKSGKVDVGCTTSEYGINMLIRKGIIKPGDLKVLWQSDPIVGSPVVVRNDINKEFAQKIKQAYLDVSKEAPEAFGAYAKLYYPDPSKLSYLPVQDSMYNGLRKIAAGIKDLNLVKQ